MNIKHDVWSDIEGMTIDIMSAIISSGMTRDMMSGKISRR